MNAIVVQTKAAIKVTVLFDGASYKDSSYIFNGQKHWVSSNLNGFQINTIGDNNPKLIFKGSYCYVDKRK